SMFSSNGNHFAAISITTSLFILGLIRPLFCPISASLEVKSHHLGKQFLMLRWLSMSLSPDLHAICISQMSFMVGGSANGSQVKVPSLKQFNKKRKNGKVKTSSLGSLANAMLLLQRFPYHWDFKLFKCKQLSVSILRRQLPRPTRGDGEAKLTVEGNK
ncbi:hypothetical protein MKW98_014090, partial [Papaver atlanticum]